MVLQKLWLSNTFSYIHIFAKISFLYIKCDLLKRLYSKKIFWKKFFLENFNDSTITLIIQYFFMHAYFLQKIAFLYIKCDVLNRFYSKKRFYEIYFWNFRLSLKRLVSQKLSLCNTFSCICNRMIHAACD